MTPEGSARGVSTVADVALALLLIGAAVATVAVFIDDRATGVDPDRADRTAETLAATTASAEYSLRPLVEGGGDPFDEPDEYDDRELARVSRGATAGLLADAAVANVRVDGERLTDAGLDYERAVDAAVADVLRGATEGFDVEVVAVWRPYEGAPVEGRATAGERPPPDADVGTATATVPSGLPGARSSEGGESSYEAVAAAVATAVVEGLAPPTESRRALEGNGLERAAVVHRYERFATVLEEGDPDDEAFASHLERSGANATAANEYLIERLAARFAPDLERSFDDPDAAARAASTGEVTLVVNVWRR